MATLTTLHNRPPLLLRRSLLADVVASGGVGLAILAGAAPLSGLLGLPPALLQEAGLFLLVYVAFVISVAVRTPIPTGGAWAVIILNVLWAAASGWLLLSGAVQPTLLGTAFVIFQALVVAGLGVLQYSGLGKS